MQNRNLLEPISTLVALGLLIGGCVMILLPFASALVWAAIFVFSTRHFFWRVNAALGERSWLSASIFVMLILGLLVLPLLYAIVSFGGIASDFALKIINQLQVQDGVPSLPAWITDIRWVGPKIQAWWDKLILGDADVRQQVKDSLLIAMKGLLAFGAITGQSLGMLLLSCFISLFFYASLPAVTQWLQTSVQRVSGSRAEQLLNIAGGTIQGVVFGILGTALAQGFLVGIALFAAGIPSAAGLTFLAIILSLVPFGSFLIWGPATFWLYHNGQTAWAVAMVVWCAGIAGSADNVIKPLVIGQNSNLPFILIMLGILGGALQFGALGVFLGPTLLALGLALAKEWLYGIKVQQTSKEAALLEGGTP
ncbi:MAG TPA: AI-2E family transporter [Pseudomonadales bacterium]|nr:AI-2E family transporter [Pseudomonadales bacterium]